MARCTTSNGKAIIKAKWGAFAKQDGSWTMILFDVTYQLLKNPAGAWCLYSRNGDGEDFNGKYCGATLLPAADAAIDLINDRDLRGARR